MPIETAAKPPRQKSNKRKMDVRLLRRIQKVILAEPRRVNMAYWAKGRKDLIAGNQVIDDWWGYNEDLEPSQVPPCGTVGCICGWGIALTTKLRSDKLAAKVRKSTMDRSFPRGALKLFGLTGAQADRLFIPTSWPDDYYERLNKYSFGTKRYAKVVCARIDRFIKTKGVE